MNQTPGPYPLTVTKVDDFFVIVTNQGNHFAKTFDPCAARLIASAPDLLLALENLLSAQIDPMGIKASHARREAYEVISKAKGQP